MTDDEALAYLAMAVPHPRWQGRAVAVLRETIQGLRGQVGECADIEHRARYWADEPTATPEERAIARSILTGAG